MDNEDFKTYGIKHFTSYDLIQSKASIYTVSKITIIKLDKLRDLLGMPVHIIENGLNTGKHKFHEHSEGKAVDCICPDLADQSKLFYNAIMVGFRGIGIYYCAETSSYTYHLDIRNTPHFWGAQRMFFNEDYNYMNLIIDPRKEVINTNGQFRKRYSDYVTQDKKR